MEQEVTLGEKVRDAGFTDKIPDPDLAFHLLELNQANRKVFVGDSLMLPPLENAIKALGYNAIVGRERFFELPLWRNFECEKAAASIETLELMKAAGLVYPFLNQLHLVFTQAVVSHAKQTMVESSNEGEESLRFMSAQSLFLEVAFLFTCGFFLSILASSLLENPMALLKWRRKWGIM